MSTRYFMGIDPGASGAIAMLHRDGTIRGECNLSPDFAIVADRLRSLLVQTAGSTRIGVVAVVEQAQTMPKQGIVSAFHYGASYGGILMALAWNCIPYRLVSPRKWKVQMGLSSDKALSLKMARELFPTMDLPLKKDHNRAEAALLALWLLRQETGAR